MFWLQHPIWAEFCEFLSRHSVSERSWLFVNILLLLVLVPALLDPCRGTKDPKLGRPETIKKISESIGVSRFHCCRCEYINASRGKLIDYVYRWGITVDVIRKSKMFQPSLQKLPKSSKNFKAISATNRHRKKKSSASKTFLIFCFPSSFPISII